MEYNVRIMLTWLFVFTGLALAATLMFCAATAGILQAETCNLLLGLAGRLLPG